MCNSDFIAQAFEYTINQKSPCFYLPVKVNSKETSCNEIMKILVDLWFPAVALTTLVTCETHIDWRIGGLP